MAPPQARKKSEGRKKIEMKMIEDDSARMVSFSKRRVSLFRKATELSVLCGARIALIIFSLGGRAHSFGHPNLKSVLNSYFNNNLLSNLPGCVHGSGTAVNMKQLKDEYDEKSAELQNKKTRAKEIEAALKNSMLSEERIGMLNLDQLKHLKETMETLKANMRRMLPSTSQIVSGEPVSNSIDVAGPSNRETAAVDASKRDRKEASPMPPAWSNPNIDLNLVDNCGSSSEDEGDAAILLKLKEVGQTTVESTDGNNAATVSHQVKQKKFDLANVAGEASPIPPDWLSLRSDYHG